jgi:hypothetical protein
MLSDRPGRRATSTRRDPESPQRRSSGQGWEQVAVVEDGAGDCCIERSPRPTASPGTQTRQIVGTIERFESFLSPSYDGGSAWPR